MAVLVEIAASSFWRAPSHAVGLLHIDFLYRGDDNLGAWLDVLFSQRRILICQLSVPGVGPRAVGTRDAVCVVEQKLVDDTLILHRQLRPIDVILDFAAEVLQGPVSIELDFKFDLLGGGALGVSILVRIVRIVALEVAVFDLDSHEQLDALVVANLVAWDEGRRRCSRVLLPLLLLINGLLLLLLLRVLLVATLLLALHSLVLLLVGLKVDALG